MSNNNVDFENHPDNAKHLMEVQMEFFNHKHLFQKLTEQTAKIEKLERHVERLSYTITKLSRIAVQSTNDDLLKAVVSNATEKINAKVIEDKAVELIEAKISLTKKLQGYVESTALGIADNSKHWWRWEGDVVNHFGSRLKDYLKDNFEILVRPKEKTKPKKGKYIHYD